MTNEEYLKRHLELLARYEVPYAHAVLREKIRTIRSLSNLYEQTAEYDIDNIWQPHINRLIGLERRHARIAMTGYAGLSIPFTNEKHRDNLLTRASFNWRELSNEYIENNALAKSTLKSQTLKNTIADIIQAHQDKGLREISREIRNQAPKFAKYQSERIARTEILQASDYANRQVFNKTKEITGLEYNKVWLTAGDERVRDSHANLHNISIPESQLFNVNGFDAPEPRDNSLPVAEIIHCRCRLINEPVLDL